MLEAIYNKWKIKTVTNEEEATQQPIPAFINCAKAIDMLHRHITNNSKIAIHCDVDLDGIGSGFIAKRFIESISSTPTLCVINKGKEHGIKERHATYFNNNPIDLMLIVDSSSNDVDIIKQFNCDVLVVDHHEVDHKELSGITNDGKHEFIIVNNTLDNLDSKSVNEWLKINNPNTSVHFDGYIADVRMSCGVVIYELLRLYQEAYSTGNLLENMWLYQWAGVTLFTDVIQLITERNQWYIYNTVHSMYVEPTLKIMMNQLNKFIVTLDKSFINYTLAPTFNRAIRANANGLALSIVMNTPYNIGQLNIYRDIQDKNIEEGVKLTEEHDTYCKVDLTNSDIDANYTGVIAGKVCDITNKNCVSYKVNKGIAKGSFRGRSQKADYRAGFTTYSDDVFAQGHKQAFGFEVAIEELDSIMAGLINFEPDISTDKPYLTAGNLPDNLKGEYHIDDMHAFQMAGGLAKLGNGNSRVSSDEQILITTSSQEAQLMEQKGRLYYYNLFGLTCKAFKEIEPGMINLYVETGKTIDFFIK